MNTQKMQSQQEEPIWVCIILRRGNQILMEKRGPEAKRAAGRLTCFGGKRETNEQPLACVLRECQEELQWRPSPDVTQHVCDLYVDQKLIAYFYLAPGPTAEEETTLVYEPGRQGVWIEEENVTELESVSPWHTSVFEALKQGRTRADFITADTR